MSVSDFILGIASAIPTLGELQACEQYRLAFQHKEFDRGRDGCTVVDYAPNMWFHADKNRDFRVTNLWLWDGVSREIKDFGLLYSTVTDKEREQIREACVLHFAS